MSIFAELIHAVYDFKSYPAFRENGAGRVFAYGLLLNIFYFVLALILPITATITALGGFGNIAKEAIPDFRLEDGRLQVEEVCDIQEYDTYYGGVCIRVDTSQPITEEITDVDLLAFDRVIVMDEEHMIFKAEGGSAIRTSYKEMNLGNWNRETLLEKFVPLLPLVLWTVLFVVIFLGLFGFFFGALMVAMFGHVLSAFLGCRLRFGELYKLAVYARTPALAVESVYAWMPFSVGYFYVVSYGISVFYMWKALQGIKKELDVKLF